MQRKEIERLLSKIYTDNQAAFIHHQLPSLLEKYQLPNNKKSFSEEDIILITYGNMVTKEDESPLKTLHTFLALHAAKVINTIHILPFFPYSSDEGFSVIDYISVNPVFGTWDNIHSMRQDFNLMFDLVANHASVDHQWFQKFLVDSGKYADYFITVPPGKDTSDVFRPRTSPLLTEFETARGRERVWTTFSADQVDLNYKSPHLLLEMINIMLYYVAQGASFIRLDAIAYIWKELGTSCIHLPQVHCIVQLMRAILDIHAPGVKLITETNVPHKDNIRYFGDGYNEAQLVYNFSLPPLTLYAFHSGNSEIFTRWAAALKTPSDETTFFNFLASHDGIGITPAHGILSNQAIARMADKVEAAGGYVSYKTNADGSESAYEFNINFFDALNDPDQENGLIELKVRRFITAHAVMTALQGIPGIYFHSLFGSTSWIEGAEKSGTPRTINRERLALDTLESDLTDHNSLRSRIFIGFKKLLAARIHCPAFHPNAPQKAPLLHQAIITIIRDHPESGFSIICLHNVSEDAVEIDLGNNLTFTHDDHALSITYQNSDKNHPLQDSRVMMAPYETVWIRCRLQTSR